MAEPYQHKPWEVVGLLLACFIAGAWLGITLGLAVWIVAWGIWRLVVLEIEYHEHLKEHSDED